MLVHRYIELTSFLGISKKNKIPVKDLEEKVYQIIQKEMNFLLGKDC